jgi:hypothetical protein
MSVVPMPAHESLWASVIPEEVELPDMVETHVSFRSFCGISSMYSQ